MAHRSPKNKLTLQQLKDEALRQGKTLTDMPPMVVREVQKHGFPDMRSILLPPTLIQQSLNKPLLKDLLVTRIGYCTRAAGHYIPRPKGSLDHIIHYCIAGKGWLQMAGQRWDIPRHTTFLLPRDEPHSYGADAKQPWSLYWIHFTGGQAKDYFNASSVSAQSPLLHLPYTEEITTAFSAIEHHMMDVHTLANLIAASSALARFLGLIQLRRLAVGPAERSRKESVQQTIDFMKINLHRVIPLEELAHLAHMSVSNYEASFTSRTGSPPIRYFNKMRIQQACQLLIDTNRLIRHIADDIGFSDPYHFSRVFRRHVGWSPMQFRKQNRGEDCSVEKVC